MALHENGFLDTEDDFDWMDDDFDLDFAIRVRKSYGYEQAPSDHVPDETRYEYDFVGPMLFYKKIA